MYIIKEWWSSLDQKWQAVLKEAIGINREPTADELKELFELKKLDLPIPMDLDVRPILKMPNLQFIKVGKRGNFDLNLTPSPSHSKPSNELNEHLSATEIENWAFRKYRRKQSKLENDLRALENDLREFKRYRKTKRKTK